MLSDIASVVDREGGPRLVELGKIKVGGLGQARQSAGGNTYRQPVKYDSFLITHCHRSQQAGGARGDLLVNRALMDELLELHPSSDGKLRRIPIRLLSDDLDDVMRSAFCWYGRKACGARSDGRTLTWFYDPQTMQALNPPRIEPSPPDLLERLDRQGNRMFKLHTVLDVVIAARSTTLGGVFRFRTTSRITFDQLRSTLSMIQSMSGGILVGLPLALVVREVDVAPDGKVTRVPVVHVEVAANDVAEVRRIALEQARSLGSWTKQVAEARAAVRLALPDPGLERGGEAGDVAEEFHPEATEPEPPKAAPPVHALIDGAPEAREAPAVEHVPDIDTWTADVETVPVDLPEPEVVTVPLEQPGADKEEAERLAWLERHSANWTSFVAGAKQVAQQLHVGEVDCAASLTRVKLESDVMSARKRAHETRRTLLRAMLEDRFDWRTGAMRAETDEAK